MANKNSSNSIKRLEKVRKTLNEVIDEKISNLEFDKSISSIDSVSFACLNYIFENISHLLYETKEGKKLIKEYVKTIKEFKALKTSYSFFSTINKQNSINDPYVFLNESLKIVKSIDNETYKNGTKKISNIIKECISVTHLNTNEINDMINSYNETINKDITDIIFEDISIKNSVTYSNKMSNVLNFLKENKLTEKKLKTDKTVRDILNDFDGLLKETTEEWEKALVNDISINYIGGKSNEYLFESYKNDCLNILKEAIENRGPEDVSRFSIMESKLKDKSYNIETFNEDIIKLAELKHILKS